MVFKYQTYYENDTRLGHIMQNKHCTLYQVIFIRNKTMLYAL